MTTLAESPVNYLNHRHTVASWLLTKDHKRIGLMYMVVVTIAFLIGAHGLSLPPPHVRRGGWYTLRVDKASVRVEHHVELPDFPTQ